MPGISGGGALGERPATSGRTLRGPCAGRRKERRGEVLTGGAQEPDREGRRRGRWKAGAADESRAPPMGASWIGGAEAVRGKERARFRGVADGSRALRLACG
jgi:hypothetical protein